MSNPTNADFVKKSCEQLMFYLFEQFRPSIAPAIKSAIEQNGIQKIDREHPEDWGEIEFTVEKNIAKEDVRKLPNEYYSHLLFGKINNEYASKMLNSVALSGPRYETYNLNHIVSNIIQAVLIKNTGAYHELKVSSTVTITSVDENNSTVMFKFRVVDCKLLPTLEFDMSGISSTIFD